MKSLLLAAAMAFVSATLFADADLRLTASQFNPATVVAGELRQFVFTVHNDGPDAARDVILTVTATGDVSTGLCATGCLIGNGTVPVGDQQLAPTLLFPETPGDVTITASVASSTPDANTGNNQLSLTIHVSPDPYVHLSVFAPANADLALPFPLNIYLYNGSPVAAHDVDVTVDFRPDVTVATLPPECSNPAAGRVVCRAGTLTKSPSGALQVLTIILFGPQSYGSGFVNFTATATAREPNFDPSAASSRSSTSLYVTFYVTTTADSGAGSLRQAILDANAATGGPLAIEFRIPEPSATPWKTIRVNSPLPAITAYALRIDGSTQSGFFGDANPDGPEIEISGGGTVDGDGLLIESCQTDVSNLAIGGFLRNGVSVTWPLQPLCSGLNATELHHLFIGSDPAGTVAHPNARGIGIAVASTLDYSTVTNIHDCVISGNVHSGIFDLDGLVIVRNNRIGVKAHADEPLPNGNSGVFIGTGGSGSDVGGTNILSAGLDRIDHGNVIAFNGETGVAIAAGLVGVDVQNNRIWSNRLLGIDIGLDGPTGSTPTDFGEELSRPTLTLAQYDPASDKTIIEGDIVYPRNGALTFNIQIFASDAADPSGFGEGQRPLGYATVDRPSGHFRFETAGDLSGQWITATNTSTGYGGFAKPQPDGIDQGFQTQTSEFSRGITVQ